MCYPNELLVLNNQSTVAFLLLYTTYLDLSE